VWWGYLVCPRPLKVGGWGGWVSFLQVHALLVVVLWWGVAGWNTEPVVNLNEPEVNQRPVVRSVVVVARHAVGS
jgi:hypothetical protein